MPLFADTKKSSYIAQRGASQGAGITLVSGPGQWNASFDCAKRISKVLGNRDLKDAGDGILESIPLYKITSEDLQQSCQKLSAQFSIALVELVCDRAGATRFALLWKIAQLTPTIPKHIFNPDEF